MIKKDNIKDNKKNEKINPISKFIKELSQAEVAPISLHGSDKK